MQGEPFKVEAHEVFDTKGNRSSHRTTVTSPSGKTIVTLIMLEDGTSEFTVTRGKKTIAKPLIVFSEDSEFAFAFRDGTPDEGELLQEIDKQNTDEAKEDGP